MLELVRELIDRVKTADDWCSPRHVEALVVLDEFRDDPCYVADVIGLLLDRIAEHNVIADRLDAIRHADDYFFARLPAFEIHNERYDHCQALRSALLTTDHRQLKTAFAATRPDSPV